MKSQLLYQLSYTPNATGERSRNNGGSRRGDYQSVSALSTLPKMGAALPSANAGGCLFRRVLGMHALAARAQFV